MLANGTHCGRKMLICSCRVRQEEEAQVDANHVTKSVEWRKPCIPLYESIVGVRKAEYINLFTTQISKLRLSIGGDVKAYRVVEKSGFCNSSVARMLCLVNPVEALLPHPYLLWLALLIGMSVL